MTTKLIDTGFANKNIATGTNVYTYLIPLDGTYRFDMYLRGVQGSGTYTAWVVNQLGSGSVQTILAPTTDFAANVIQTNFGFPSISLDLVTNDVVGLWIGGLAGDTTVTGTVRIWRENYSTLVQSDILSDATPFGGANIDDAISTAVTQAGNAASYANGVLTILTGITSLADWLRGLARKDNMEVIAKAELNLAGGTYDESTDSLEAQHDSYTTPPTPGTIADAVLDEAGAGHTGLIPTNLDTNIGSRSTLTVANILAGILEGTSTIQDFFRLTASVLFGKSSGGGTNNPKFRDLSDTKNRIDATTTANGDRTSITRDAT